MGLNIGYNDDIQIHRPKSHFSSIETKDFEK